MKLDTVTARRRLVNRREPNYVTISPGRSLGFRRFQDDVGHWSARYRNKKRKYSYQPLGNDIDLTYEQALQAASAWFLEVAAADGDDRRPITVETALRDYLDFLSNHRKESTWQIAKSRSKNYIVPKLGKTLLTDLTARQVRDWHHGLVRKTKDADARRASQDSANKVLTILKAALTRAAFGKKIDATAWTSVKPFKGTTVSRAVFWSKPEVERLVRACHDPDLKDLVLAAWLTGARPGELFQAEIRDFDGGTSTWDLRIGKTGARRVVLVSEAAALFSRRTAGRKPGDRLFTRGDGVAWDKDNIQKPLADALEVAGLEGSLYAARHSHVSFALNAGAPVKAISSNTGTSLMMIERHYGHITDKARREAFDAVGFGGAVDATVTKIERAKH